LFQRGLGRIGENGQTGAVGKLRRDVSNNSKGAGAFERGGVTGEKGGGPLCLALELQIAPCGPQHLVLGFFFSFSWGGGRGGFFCGFSKKTKKIGPNPKTVGEGVARLRIRFFHGGGRIGGGTS